MNDLSSPRRTRKIMKMYRDSRQLILLGRIIFLPLFLVAIIPFSIFQGFGNLYFFFLSISPFIITYIFSFSIIYLMVDDYNVINKWNERKSRIDIFKGKVILSVIEGIFLLIISLAILGFCYLTNFPQSLDTTYRANNVGLESPFSYQPSLLDILLLFIIIALSIVAIFSSIYWLYMRFMQITGYNSKRKILSIKASRIAIGWIVQSIIWFIVIPVLCNVLFIDICYPALSESWSVLKQWYSDSPYLILVFQIIILLFINVLTFIDGIYANRNRKNFVTMKNNISIQ
ncbi:MAG: hypothetical protein KGD64_08090 [Candidatus Heimdallarchaeota archaeon]|nr:hypothetical protein [Candidatus Heimdallarchaeota archaeon]